MARKSQEMRRLEAKEIEVAADIAHLEQALQNARALHRDIQTAKRVLEEISGVTHSPVSEPASEAESEDDGDEETPEAKAANQTIGEMALTLLRNDPEGMTSNEILEHIRKHWVTDLARTSLSPPLSRLKKKGVIYLDGERWKIVPQIPT